MADAVVLQCQLCSGMLEAPITTVCGCSFCHVCLEGYYSRQTATTSSPTCPNHRGAELAPVHYWRTNTVLQGLVSKLRTFEIMHLMLDGPTNAQLLNCVCKAERHGLRYNSKAKDAKQREAILALENEWEKMLAQVKNTADQQSARSRPKISKKRSLSTKASAKSARGPSKRPSNKKPPVGSPRRKKSSILNTISDAVEQPNTARSGFSAVKVQPASARGHSDKKKKKIKPRNDVIVSKPSLVAAIAATISDASDDNIVPLAIVHENDNDEPSLTRMARSASPDLPRRRERHKSSPTKVPSNESIHSGLRESPKESRVISDSEYSVDFSENLAPPAKTSGRVFIRVRDTSGADEQDTAMKQGDKIDEDAEEYSDMFDSMSIDDVSVVTQATGHPKKKKKKKTRSDVIASRKLKSEKKDSSSRVKKKDAIKKKKSKKVTSSGRRRASLPDLDVEGDEAPISPVRMKSPMTSRVTEKERAQMAKRQQTFPTLQPEQRRFILPPKQPSAEIVESSPGSMKGYSPSQRKKKSKKKSALHASMYHPGKFVHRANNEPYSWTCCFSKVRDSMGCRKRK